MARIIAACKDAGGTNGMLPVAHELRAMGHTVVFLAHRGSPAEEIIRNAGENPLVFASAIGYLNTYGLPDVLVTDMSAKGGVGWDLALDMRQDARLSFALQDVWGGGLLNEWADPRRRPSSIIVGDNIGAEAVKKAWPEYDRSHICVSGFPALDEYARSEGIFAEGERMKKEHGIAYVPSVFYAGSTFNGRGLKILTEAVQRTGRRVDLIVRPHQEMQKYEPDEALMWEDAKKRYEKLGAGYKVVEPRRREWSTPALIAAADVTVSVYSMVLLEAVMLRKPNITLWTPEVREAFMSAERGFGGLLTEFPPAAFNCTAEAKSVEELANLLALAFAGEMNLSAAQALYYPADGRNSRRAAEFIHARIFES